MNSKQSHTLYFYQGDHLHTNFQGSQGRTIFRTAEQALAEIQPHQQSNPKFLAIDAQGSVIHAQAENHAQAFTYTAYGHDPVGMEAMSVLRFNGEYREPLTQSYLLGNGYRAYSAVMMRFRGPDNLSPFDEGGLNAYAYCNGDPVNLADPSGHSPLSSFFKGIGNILHLRKKGTSPSTATLSPPSARGLDQPAGSASLAHSGARTSGPVPRLPEYSKELPKGHRSGKKAKNLLIEEINELEQAAHKRQIAGNRVLLFGGGKHLVNGKAVPEKFRRQANQLHESARALTAEAQTIRVSPDVSPPPRYEHSR